MRRIFFPWRVNIAVVRRGFCADYVVKFPSPSCVRFISFGFLLATACVWVWMVCSLHSVTTGSRDRAYVPLIIIIICRRPDSHTCFFGGGFLLFLWRCRFFLFFFPSIFCTIAVFFCMESSTSYVLSFRVVFFYLVTTGWTFDISLCENSISQSDQSSCLVIISIPTAGGRSLGFSRGLSLNHCPAV